MICREAGRRSLDLLAVLVGVGLVGCQATPSAPGASPSGSPGGSAAVTPSQPAPAHTRPDLAKRPLVFYAPLPPQRGGPYDGSTDWSELWQPGADWDELAGMIDVYKLYGGWAFSESTRAEAERIAQTLDGYGLGLAVETSPLIPADGCGLDDQGNLVEGFAGEQARDTMENLRRGGATVDVITLDEPWYYAHVYDGPGACHWDDERIAQGVADFLSVVRQSFPNVVVGDIEPTPAPVSADELGQWLDAWQRVVGEPAAFLHLDLDFGRTGWPDLVTAAGDEAHGRGVPLGVIAIGDPFAKSDVEWLQAAGARLSRLRFTMGYEPDHLIFQSWHDRPDRALPESDPTTYTGWLLAYLQDPQSEVAIGPPSVSLDAKVRASMSLPGSPPPNAVDGDQATTWNAGDGPEQWIQIDLATMRSLAGVRLSVAQYPAGMTVHEVWVGSTKSSLHRVHTFRGETQDGDVLTWTPATPLSVRSVRIVTTESPSWVAWREIDLIGGP